MELMAEGQSSSLNTSRLKQEELQLRKRNQPQLVSASINTF